MGAFLALLSSLKSEISWIISSLAVAPAAAEEQASSDAQPPGDKPADDAKDGNAQDADGKLASIVDPHAANTPVHHTTEIVVGDFLHRVHDDASESNDSPAHSYLLAAASSNASLIETATVTPVADVNPVAVATSGFGEFTPHGLFEDVGFHPVPFPDFNPNLLLVNGDGDVVSSFAHGAGGSHRPPGGGGGGTPASYTTSGSLKITLTFDTSVATAPSGFLTDIKAAADFLAAHFNDPANITINVGFGKIDGQPLGGGALGESLTYLASTNYANLLSHLQNDGTSTTDGRGTLTATDPISGTHTYWVSTAEAKALGITVFPPPPVDGYVGFAAQSGIFAYGTESGGSVGGSQYDFFATAVHELTEVMGRMLLTGGSIGSTSNSYDVLDLFHYSGNGVRDFSGSTAGYFSVNSGATDLHDFNTVAGGDYGDWASGHGADSFNAYGTPGIKEPVGSFDLTVMDAIGWNLV